jgi:hypothetical protein
MNIRAAGCILLLVPFACLAGPDVEKGRTLVRDSGCETCHQRQVAGPVGTIYLRKDHKVTSWAKLKSQVAMCNSQLKLGLFPEDEADIAAFLNETYYKLPTK